MPALHIRVPREVVKTLARLLHAYAAPKLDMNQGEYFSTTTPEEFNKSIDHAELALAMLRTVSDENAEGVIFEFNPPPPTPIVPPTPSSDIPTPLTPPSTHTPTEEIL